MAQPDMSPEALTAYLAQAIQRAAGVYGSRRQADPAHALALGEAVALFNLADEFGLIAEVRRAADQLVGRDVYRGLSEAMKAYYLGAASGPAPGEPGRAGAARPPTRRPDEDHPAGPRPARPPGPPRRPGPGAPNDRRRPPTPPRAGPRRPPERP